MPHDLPLPPRDLLTDAALFLDFDGTLVDLADTPDGVSVDARLADLIRTLTARLDGRLAIVSGRPVDSILALFGDVPFAVAGSHGLEIRWPDGGRTLAERPPALDTIQAEMTALADTIEGLLVERKPLGAALHFRNAPAAGDESVALATRLAAQHGLHLQTGKMMIEVRLPGADKGTALDALLAAPPLAGHRPVFLGDDDTDEPAMVAAARLGGAGVLIGAPRPTAAAWRLPDVAAARDWLESAA